MLGSHNYDFCPVFYLFLFACVECLFVICYYIYLALVGFGRRKGVLSSIYLQNRFVVFSGPAFGDVLRSIIIHIIRRNRKVHSIAMTDLNT